MREATIRLSGEELAALGIEAFVSAVRTAGLERVSELQCERPGCLLVVEVAESIPPDRLSTLETVEWWERLDASDGATYLCKLAVPAFEEGFDPYHETEVSQSDLAVDGDGLEVTIVGSHEAIADRVGEYEAVDADPLLGRLTDYDGPADPLDGLTPRQQEVLETAFELGYFAVPREATTEAVGAELDLDPSTVREHLQRAQRNLLAAVLGSA